LVNQLNLGAALISEWPEKVRAAELNLVAGRKAKTSTAYAAASTYLAAGIAVLSDDGWRRCYDLTLDLFLEQAEWRNARSSARGWSRPRGSSRCCWSKQDRRSIRPRSVVCACFFN